MRRVSEGTDPERFEDLLSIMVRVGARGGRSTIRALGDPSAAVRHLAAMTLIHSGDRDSAAALVRALEGDDFRMVEAASYVLIELIVGGAIPETLAFPTIRRLSRSIEPRTRRNTVRALILFEDAGPSRRLLEEALADSDEEVALVARKVRDSVRDRRIHELFGFSAVGRE
ncbi:MAG: HEAT repeat domain-containing protein [Thermoanaerobaculales bacterium]